MIKAQGGIFGWVSDSTAVAAMLAERVAKMPRGIIDGGVRMSDKRAIRPSLLDAGRLERLVRLRHQHPRQHAGADRAPCASC